MAENNINIKNKKAYFQYEIIEKTVAGIELLGTEIKSIRMGKASLTDAYCQFRDKELFVKMTITEYKFGGHYNHEPNRERKLLLTHKELKRFERKVQTNGMTIVPLHLFIDKNGWAKLEIALAKGKTIGDKRQSIKERDTKRDMDRIRKNKI